MHPLRRISQLLERLRQEPIGAALVSLAGDSAVYLTGGILIGLGNVILVPLYTRCLPPREFGVYALVDVTVLLLVTVSALKLDVSYLKWFADIAPNRRGELFGSTLLAGLGTSMAGGLILWFLVGSPLGELWLHASGRSFAWMLLPIVALEALQGLFLTDLRARRRAVSYSTMAIVRLGAMITASYYLLAIRQAGLPGLFLGRLVGDGAALVFLISVSLRSVVFRISPELLKPMLRFGLPLIWSVFTVMLQDASGRYFLSRYGTLEQVGLLGAAIKIGAVFQILVTVPFGVAWGGMLFQIVKERGAQAIYSKIFDYVYVVALVAALVLAVFGTTLLRIFTAPAYYAAAAVLPFVLLVRAISVIEQPLSVGMYLSGRTGLLAISYTAALGLNLGLLRLLVPAYGLLGVGWAWLLGSAAVPVLFVIFGQRLYRLSFRPKLLIVPLLLWAMVMFVVPQVNNVWPDHQLRSQVEMSLAVLIAMGLSLASDLRLLRQRLRTHSSDAEAIEVSPP